MSISTSDFKKGMKIEIDGVPFKIIDMVHIQQKRRAVVKVKLKNILSGAIAENTFLSGEKVDRPDMEEKEMEYLYHDGDHYNFMDKETFEQIVIDISVIDDIVPYMKENEQVQVMFYNGNPISVELPQFIIGEIAETEPGFKGNTVTTTFKPAKLVTGGQVMVPLFLNSGDVIKINTEEFTYCERIKAGR